MDLPVEKLIENVLSEEAVFKPSDAELPEESEIKLPVWFDRKKFNQGRRFYWDNGFPLGNSMMAGLVVVFSIPSILEILVGSQRSTSIYTAYKRYLSTFLHVFSWFEEELEPGSRSWKSLYAVRSRHFRAGKAAKLRGNGMVRQRDLALTQYGFFGLPLLKPDRFGIRQLKPSDWDAYVHFWGVIGHMVGIEDRYNICRKTAEETRQVCQVLTERVFAPCLNNVPEYFVHMVDMMVRGMWHVNPITNTGSLLYLTKCLVGVPGYVFTEDERIMLQRKIKEHLKDHPEDTGVESTSLLKESAVEGLPSGPPRLLYLRDYDCLDTVPEYKQLTFFEKFNLNAIAIGVMFYSTYLGRLFFNFIYAISNFFANYFPYVAFISFGVRAAYVNMFVESPLDNTKPKPNSEYYKPRVHTTKPWHQRLLSSFW